MREISFKNMFPDGCIIPQKSDILDLTKDELPLAFEIRKGTNDVYYLHDLLKKWPCRGFVLSKNSASYIQVDVSFSGNDGKLSPEFLFSRRNIRDGSIRSLSSSAKEDKLGLVELKGDASKKFWDLIACLSQCHNVDVTNFKRHKILESDKVLEINDKNLKDVVHQLIDRGYSEDVLREILEKDADLSETFAKSALQEQRERDLSEFREHLKCLDWKEPDWDSFFGNNRWIFGLGLDYRFLVTERTQANLGGHDVITGKGDRRTDTLSSTDGDLNFTILIEIKKPDTPIFGGLYRKEKVPLFSEDFYGGINQILSDTKYWELQGSKTEENRDVLDRNGIYTISPKGILVIGKMKEFENELHKRNIFQHFRRNNSSVEILTYDELFKRAYYVVFQKRMPHDYLVSGSEI